MNLIHRSINLNWNKKVYVRQIINIVMPWNGENKLIRLFASQLSLDVNSSMAVENSDWFDKDFGESAEVNTMMPHCKLISCDWSLVGGNGPISGYYCCFISALYGVSNFLRKIWPTVIYTPLFTLTWRPF